MTDHIPCAIPSCRTNPNGHRYVGFHLCSIHQAEIDRRWEQDRPAGAPLRDGVVMVKELIEANR